MKKPSISITLITLAIIFASTACSTVNKPETGQHVATINPSQESQSKPTFEKTEQSQLSFEYKTYVMLPHIELNAKQIEIAKIISEAIEAGKTEVAVSGLDKESFDQMYCGYIWSNPLSAIVEAVRYDENNSKATIEYTFPLDEHMRRINEWKILIDKIITENIEDVDDPEIAALNLYWYFVKSIEYDFEILMDNPELDFVRTTAYGMFTLNKGVCNQYAKAYNYLLMQLGIDCYYVEGSGHAWSVVKLGENYYHCDPTFDSTNFNDEGKPENYSLKFYGIDNATRDASLGDPPFVVMTDVKQTIVKDINEFVNIPEGNYKMPQSINK